MKIFKKMPLAAICCLMAAMLTGCVAMTSSARKETLEERVQKYMQAQLDRKWDQAYSFFDSSYREMVPKEDYIQRSAQKIVYKGFTIEEITVLPSGNEATVKVRIDLSSMGMVFPRAPETQNWVKEKGEWFMKSSNKSNPSSRGTPFTREKKQK